MLRLHGIEEYVRLHSHLSAYLLPALAALVAAQLVVSTPGTVVAFGDYAPPFAPGDEYRSHWNQLTDGGGSPSFEIVSLPYYETLQTLGALGLSPEAAQRLWLSGLLCRMCRSSGLLRVQPPCLADCRGRCRPPGNLQRDLARRACRVRCRSPP